MDIKMWSLWWVNRLITLSKAAGIVAVSTVFLISYAWLIAESTSLPWGTISIGGTHVYSWAAIVTFGMLTFLVGVLADQCGHTCKPPERRDNCARYEGIVSKDARNAQEWEQTVRALVFSSQDKLDELLKIFGERVSAACEAQKQLQAQFKGDSVHPRDELKNRKLETEIDRYRHWFDDIRRHAPNFGLVVSYRWSAYFPEPEKDNVAPVHTV